MAQANGLLDWIQTPAGIGLLSAVAGGMAGAQRGTPWNNAGRAGIAGLAGYTGAKDQINKESDNALTRQYRQMQMQELESKIAQQKALREAATSAYQDATKPAQFAVGGQTFPNQQAAQMSAESMFSLPSSAAPGTDQPLMSFQSGQQAPASIADFSGGQVPQVTQQQTPSVRNAMYTRLMQAGFPEEATKYAPKEAEWIVSERYNEKTGMPEKVLMNKNDPTDIRPFGGAQADTVVADNLGGQLVYRGSRSATPLGVMDKTATPDALMTDARTRAEGAANRAVSIRGQDLSNSGSKAPAGYRFNADGNLEAIPGGPADIKAGEIGAKTEQRRVAAITQANNVLGAVGEAKDLVGFTTAGFGAINKNIPATDARNLDAKLTTIKANLGFDRLQQMRDMSPTGGALGQVAVQELVALQSTVASLDQAQSPAELRRALGKIETHYNNWLETLEPQQPGGVPAPAKTAKPAATFDLPPNAKQYEGKTLRDTKSGKRFKSVGGKWQEVK